MVLEEAVVTKHETFSGAYRRLAFRAPRTAPFVQPGQFVHVRLPAPSDALLRRPFSVYRTEGEELQIIYKAVGRGTQAMRHLEPGMTLSLLGPLGKGFPEPDSASYPILVAGGYGMAALYMQARRCVRKGIAFFGGSSAQDILCVPEFEALGWTVRVTTDDGSLGEQGLVTRALDAWMEAYDGAEGPPEFFACGPNGMLKAVADRAVLADRRAWISMDRHMGCGVGACLTCVQKVATPEGGWTWARVCREGPVFECRDVIWEAGEVAAAAAPVRTGGAA